MAKVRIAFFTIHLLISGLVSGCATHSSGTSGAGSANHQTSSTTVVENYLAALNRRDLLALTLYLTPDVEWYSALDGERILEVSGREELKQMLTRFFSDHERTLWTPERIEAVENFVAVIERSQWSEGSRMESRDSLGVYELDSGRIRRITYFLNGH